MAGTVHQSAPAPGVIRLELDNPPMNAMTTAMLMAVRDVLARVEQDDAVRALVITGAGRAFCAGADLKEAARDGEDLALFGEVLEMVAGLRVPVVAAVNGACVGGGLELALCCDIRLASTAATFVAAGVNVGLMASTWRLPRLIGIGRAKAMLLTGLPTDAATAERFGLVTAVHAPDDLMPAVAALAARIASRAPLSVEASKRVIDRALDLPAADARRVAAAELGPLRDSADHQEAVAAFLTKRQPVFGRR